VSKLQKDPKSPTKGGACMKEWKKPHLRELGTNMTECYNPYNYAWNWNCGKDHNPPDEETSGS
jgi:hypothetical protein